MRHSGLLALGALLAQGALPVAAAPCDPWPGEPDPLPTLSEEDPLRAEWAALRVQELANAARRFESEDPLRAQQMWRRLLCMDPANDEALTGVLRSRAVLVHRPALVDAPFEETRVRDPWESLDAPIGLRRVPTREEQARAELRRLRDRVGRLEERVRTAHFEEALALAPDLRARLGRAEPGGTRTNLIAQMEVLAATAELALGRQREAEVSLQRAIEADPSLSLDPATTSPKVLRALAAAREAQP